MKKLISFFIVLIITFSLSACSNDQCAPETGAHSTDTTDDQSTSEADEQNKDSANDQNTAQTEVQKSTGTAYLYGEQHGVPEILEKEFELWKNYYHEDGMRHLFIELPFYSAEFLNLWMKAEDDTILDKVFLYAKGTAMDTPETKEFYKKIKESCPETIFHGIDVGHQYETSGNDFLTYLSENNLQDTEIFRLTIDAIEQGKKFYYNSDFVYRENMLVENFKREFDKLGDENVMGIFGSWHINLGAYIADDTLNMATQLKEYYEENIKTEDITYMLLMLSPIKTDTITLNKKQYNARYFGEQDLSSLFPQYAKREFWKLDDAFEDLKTAETTGNVLPLNNYPIAIEINEIYVVDYTKADGTFERQVFRYDGTNWEGRPATQQIIAE